MKLAALIAPETSQQIEGLYKAYLTLEQQEQALLSIMSVIYKPIALNKLEQLVELLISRSFLKGVKQDYTLSPQRTEQLIKKQLLRASKDGLQLNILLTNRLSFEVEQLPTLQPYSAQSKRLEIIYAAEHLVPVSSYPSGQTINVDKHRMVRDLYYLGDTEGVEQMLAFNKNPQVVDHRQNLILVELFFLPFDFARFTKLPNALQYQAFATLFRLFQQAGENCQYPIELLEKVCKFCPDRKRSNYNQSCWHLLAEQYVYQMRFRDFQHALVENDSSSYALQLKGAFSFLTGKNDQAIDQFKQALVAKNTLSKRKNPYLNELMGYFYKLALMVEANQQEPENFTLALQQIGFEESERKFKSDFLLLSRALEKPIRCLSTGGQYSSPRGYNSVAEDIDYFCHHLSDFNHLLAQVWCNQSHETVFVALASQLQAKFQQLGYGLFAEFCGQLLASLDSADPERTLLVNLPSLIETKPAWDLALDKLIALSPNVQQDTSEKLTKSARLIWVLSHDYMGYRVSAREQKLHKSGWNKGRVVSLKRLKEESDSFAYLTVSDKRLCNTIEVDRGWGYYAKTEYHLQGLSALEGVVGIDNLYLADNLSRPIELIRREPELLVSEQGDQLCLSIADISASIAELDDTENQPQYSLSSLSETQYQLTVFSPEHIKVAEIIGEGGLLVPIDAKQKALEGISAIAPLLNIQSDVTELDTGLETLESNSSLIINIQPTPNGLSFTCVVMPFGEQGPAFKPGVGSASLTAEIKGKRVATERDLMREEIGLDDLDKACPAFLKMSDNVLIEDDLQSALNVLEQLERAITQGHLEMILRWPKGKTLKISQPLDSAHLQLALGKSKEWFDITGGLQVSDEQVIDLRKLLELVNTSNGRFIRLGNEQVLALSEDLRHKLDLINQVTDDGSFHPLASMQVEEATSGMRMKTLHAWDKQTLTMRQANQITPAIPSTLQAQLRDYQLVGFDWASRLAHWGAGACLADDMGLGKTLQALAILLSRASQGPSLVIAPTSVCFNWQQEALKFSPTLNIKLFADATGTAQREQLLSNLVAFDCVVISYGLLQRESALLQQVNWHTIIADEAQALKNPLAKRTKAALALKGEFKMITTGTPIENDLIELWSLFRFINPGLLGNLKRFVKRFAQPMENAKEDQLAAHKAQQGLKTLIQPFILRRMKNQVLTELPARTEINLPIEMSAKEQAFYEALRLNAIDNISQSAEQSNAGEQRIRMLAELVKLRQACCNPKLILAETDIPSAKLEALDELLKELRLNNHKALIFSQFVGHLQLIKNHLEAQGFRYQYLDGSTPQKQRQKRVNAFQQGDGDIFLISLKAGGSGLNLTAADFVIHMDPWWNPAVEDQASDRAHRMGQTRPVTIYRLITQNTIEEKIVALHQHKRDLADKLLTGNETASKLSVEDMLNLLQETF